MSAVLPAFSQSAGWRRSVPSLLMVFAVILLVYRDTAQAMVTIWLRSETFTHAILVVPIVLWLVWDRREALRRQVPSPSPVWLLPVAAAACLWLLGDLASVNSATQFAFVALLVLAVPALLGTATVRCILFPLAFLFFAVPIGDFMMPQMITWTADFTVWALRLTGVPVFREGEQLVIPSGRWSVVEACSGIRYLIASVMVGTLFAYLNFRSIRRRVLFTVASIAVPLVANWVRAYLIVMIGHLSSNTLAVGVDHLIYGWVFFGIVTGSMLLIGMRWAEGSQDEGPQPAAPSHARVASAGASWWVVGGMLVLSLAPQLAARALDASSRSASPDLELLAVPAAGWSTADSPAPSWTPAFTGAHAEWRAGFSDPQGSVVGLWVGYWRVQEYANKLVSSENVIVRTGGQWVRTASGTRPLPWPSGRLTVRTASLRGSTAADASGAPRLRVWQLYWINGTLTASDWQAKLWGAWHKLMGRGDDAAVLLFFTPLVEGSDADATLEAFVRGRLPELELQLRRVRDGH